MKIKCKVCRKETEIDELQYTPGDKIAVECPRCGNELEAIIPLREEAPAENPRVKVVDNDLKSVWYAAASTEGKQSAPAEKTEEKNAQEKKDAPVSGEALNNRVTQPTTKSPLRSDASGLQKSYSNSQSINRQDNNSSFMKIIIILVVVVVILGGWLLIGKGESANTRSDHAERKDATEAEVVEVVEVDPFYEILDHPERELSWSDIKDFDKTQLRILRNAYFARHGYIFNDPELTSFFSRFAWYHPYTKDVINSFSQIEKNNVELIRGYENR